MTDDEHPPEPFVPSPSHNPDDEPFPGEGADDKNASDSEGPAGAHEEDNPEQNTPESKEADE